MNVNVLLLPERKTQTVRLDKDADGFQMLKALGLNPENVIILRKYRPVPVDSRVRTGDDLKIIRVVSGG